MSRRHYHLLCALPSLRDLQSTPPFKKQGFLAMVRECRGPEAAVCVLLLEDDLIQREAVLCNEMDMKETDMAVLSPSQVTGDQPLPAFLLPTGPEDQEMSPHTLEVDLIWRRYFFHAAERAQRLGSHRTLQSQHRRTQQEIRIRESRDLTTDCTDEHRLKMGIRLGKEKSSSNLCSSVQSVVQILEGLRRWRARI